MPFIHTNEPKAMADIVLLQTKECDGRFKVPIQKANTMKNPKSSIINLVYRNPTRFSSFTNAPLR